MKRFVQVLLISALTCFQLYPFSSFGPLVQSIKHCEPVAELLENPDRLDLPEDITTMIVDLKYQKASGIKILELGNLTQSQLSGHNKLYSKGAIWKKVWERLSEYEIPIWYAEQDPYDTKRQEVYGWRTLREVGGAIAGSLEEIENDQNFIRTEEQHTPESYPSGIIVSRTLKKGGITKRAFLDRHSSFLMMNNATSYFGSSKYFLNLLMKDPSLNDYIPQTRVYPKKYSKTLADRIKAEVGGSRFVLKPLNAANGWGVIIADRKSLDKKLRLIFGDKNELKKMSNKTYSYWADDKNRSFIVQRFEESDPVSAEGMLYDGTMRFVVMLEHMRDNINLTFLGSYWKLPGKALHEKGTLSEKHKSDVHQPYRPTAAKLTAVDDNNVKKELTKVLPLMYLKMLRIKELERVRSDGHLEELHPEDIDNIATAFGDL